MLLGLNPICHFIISELNLASASKGQKWLLHCSQWPEILNYITFRLQLHLRWWCQGRYFCLWQHQKLCDVKITTVRKTRHHRQTTSLKHVLPAHFLASSKIVSLAEANWKYMFVQSYNYYYSIILLSYMMVTSNQIWLDTFIYTPQDVPPKTFYWKREERDFDMWIFSMY